MLAAPWPKRLLTSLTSSGWETSLGMGAAPFLAGTAAIAGQNAGHMLGRELVVEVVVDLDGRSPAAGADALDFLQREEAVGGDAFMADAELLLKALVQF